MAQVYQSFSPSGVTHVLASRSNTPHYELHVAPPKTRSHQRSVMNLSWLLDCGEHNVLVALRPRHFMFMTYETLKDMSDVDASVDRCVALLCGPFSKRRLTS